MEKVRVEQPFTYRLDPSHYAMIAGWYVERETLLAELSDALRTINEPSHPLQRRLRQATLLKPCQPFLEAYLDAARPEWRECDDLDGAVLGALEDLNHYIRFFREVKTQIGCAGRTVSQRIREDVAALLKSHAALIQPALVWVRLACRFEKEQVHLEGLDEPITSRGLTRFFTTRLRLREEDEYAAYEREKREFPPPEDCCLFAGTIGPGIDDKVGSLLEEGENYQALLLNGIGAGAADMVAYDFELFLNSKASPSEGRWRRFHIGYSDFRLEEQRRLFAVLDPGRINIDLTPTCIMIPQKSVSGIAALKYPPRTG